MQFTFSTDNPAEAAAILQLVGDVTLPQADQPKPVREAVAEAKAEARRAVAQDDPFADDPAPAADPESDPWAESPAQSSAPQRGGQSAVPADIPRSGSHMVDTPNGKRRWTFGSSDAPKCECGHVAALTEGKGANGKTWARWGCPLKFSKSSYKDACNFSSWASKK